MKLCRKRSFRISLEILERVLYILHFLCVVITSVLFHFATEMSPSKAVIMILAVTVTTIQTEEDGVYFKIEESTFLSHENAIWSGKAASLLSCSLMCARQEISKSANFITDSEACLSYKEQEQGISTCYCHSKALFISKSFLTSLSLMKLMNQRLADTEKLTFNLLKQEKKTRKIR